MMHLFIYLFFDKWGCQDLFKYLIIPSSVCNSLIPHKLGFHMHHVIIKRNPMKRTLKCWQEILNPGSHGYHEALKTTKPTPWSYCTVLSTWDYWSFCAIRRSLSEPIISLKWPPYPSINIARVWTLNILIWELTL